LPLTPPSPERAAISESFGEPYPDDVEGWGKYNLAYWHDHYADFARFFFSQCFVEPHSTKPIEDSVAWALETGPEVLGAQSQSRSESDWAGLLDQVRCPTLVIHGTRDRIHPHARGAEAARITGGSLVLLEGSGHIPNVRDPVKVNLALREFVERVAS
jgi:pimeloyl-ACP methyl ester carboxylesterase